MNNMETATETTPTETCELCERDTDRLTSDVVNTPTGRRWMDVCSDCLDSLADVAATAVGR